MVMKRLIAIVSLALLLGGCTNHIKTTVKATEQDGKIQLSSSTIDRGKTKFEVSNLGPSTHEFVVFKTNLNETDLPLSSDGFTVDEDADGVASVDEIEDITPNSTKTLTVDLSLGHYVIICNLPTHYNLGMHTSLEVK